MNFHDPNITRIKRALFDLNDVEPSSDFDLNSDMRPANVTLRQAAVLVPLIARENGLNLILTKRSAALKNHPGQIAFPGGKVDPTDTNPAAAACREAFEEIGLPIQNVDLLGSLPNHETVTGFNVHPFVGLVKSDFAPTPEPGEVDEVFEVPLAHVLSAQNYLVEGRRWRGAARKYYVVPYGPYYIWGATARMLRMMASLMEPMDAH